MHYTAAPKVESYLQSIIFKQEDAAREAVLGSADRNEQS